MFIFVRTGYQFETHSPNPNFDYFVTQTLFKTPSTQLRPGSGIPFDDETLTAHIDNTQNVI